MKTRLTSKLVSALLLVAAPAAFAQRSVMVNSTNSTLVYPTNFWTANAAAGRTGLGLGSAATNPSSAFQVSSPVLSNLASSNAVNLTNLRASNIVGVLNVSNIPSISLTNIGGTLPVIGGGTGATNASSARLNLGVPASFGSGSNSAIGGGAFNVASGQNSVVVGGYGNNALGDWSTAAGGSDNTASGTHSFAAGRQAKATNDGSFVWTDAEVPVTNFDSTNNNSFNVRARGGMSVDFGSAGIVFRNPDSVAPTRSNLGLGAVWLTNTVASNFRSDIGLGASWLTNNSATFFRRDIGLGNTNSVTFAEVVIGSGKINYGGGSPDGFRFYDGTNEAIKIVGGVASGNFSGTFQGSLTVGTGAGVTFSAVSTGLVFQDAGVASVSRTNLGLGWAALTNTNTAGFNAALYGSGTNPVLVDTNGTVVSPVNFWTSAPGAPIIQSFTPISSATNSVTNGRTVYVFSLATNVSGVTHTLQLPSGSVTEGDVAFVVHNGPTNSTTAIRVQGSTNNLISINGTGEAVQFIYRSSSWGVLPNPANVAPIYFSGTSATTNAAISRTNLGLPWSGLTNTSASGFRSDLGLVWSGLTNTNATGVRNDLGLVLTALTSSSATAFQGAIFTSTNAAPTNTTNVNAWVDIRVGTNDFKLPLYK